MTAPETLYRTPNSGYGFRKCCGVVGDAVPIEYHARRYTELESLGRGTLLPMGESSGEENANLYVRGVNEGRSGELLEATDLLDILAVFGEDGMRSYLMGIIAGQEDAAEDEEDLLEEGDEDRE